MVFAETLLRLLGGHDATDPVYAEVLLVFAGIPIGWFLHKGRRVKRSGN